jgi:tetratricopeptide (TPR) repeat protein
VKQIISIKNKHSWAYVALLAALIVYFYPTIFYDWVGLDDVDLIFNNPYIRDNRLLDIVSSVQISHFHPAVNLWLWSFYKAMGLMGVKISCLLLHMANVYLFLFFLHRYFSYSWPVVCGAALLWTLHPMSAEVLYWATGPKELLGTFGALASLHFFHQRHQTSSSALLWMASAALAILSKSTWVILFPLYLCLSFSIWKISPQRRRAMITGLALIGLITICSAVMTILGHQTLQVRSDLTQTLMQFFLENKSATTALSPYQFLTSLTFYLGRWLFPLKLTPFFHSDHTQLQWTDAAALFLFLSLIAWHWRQQHKIPWALILIVMLPLLPVLGFIPFGYKQAQASRYIYFSMPFFIAFALSAIPARFFTAVFACAACLLLAAGIDYRTTYANKENFYLRMLAVQPKSSIALTGLGTWYVQRNQTQKGYELLRDALTSDSNYLQANYNMGVLLLKQKRCDQAMQYLQHALTLNPKMEQIQAAIKHCQQELEIKK